MKYKTIDLETAWVLFQAGAHVERREGELGNDDDEDRGSWWQPLANMYGGKPEDGKERFMDCYSYDYWNFRVLIDE